MNDKIYTIEEIREIVTPIAKKHNLKAVYLFGSYARGEATAKSDVDFRVIMSDKATLFDISGLLLDLKDALGKEVDLVTVEPEKLRPRFLRNILRDEVTMYA